MAALVAGVKYGLSSQDINYENKSLIFVKLTDSAFRAIEEHLKNANKTSIAPSIQFLGNEGHLTIPSHELPGGQARFNFSLSSNEDIEGPQGSFECVRSTGPKSLAALGALTCKMRIHAKDDVYEATRHRVAAAEEQQKKNCTRVIKQSELNKSKSKKWSKWEEHRNERIAAATAATAATAAGQNGPGGRREYSRTRPPASVPQPRDTSGLPGLGIPPKAASPSNGYQRNSLYSKPQGSNHLPKAGNPEIMKRPLKERLIHMLALRPYKKPELLDRASREGLKEKDRQNFWVTVMNVAIMKMNVYQLKREMWGEVQEDWPFYSESDRTALKRRKPQNLTPPGNSDGGSSASSGQSPTSTHPGSPPSMIMSGISNKRPGYYESADGFQTKRQRISHYVKPADPPQTTPAGLFSSALPSLDMDTDCTLRPADSPTRVERSEHRIDRVPRPDRTDWQDRSDWTDRPDRVDWNDRNDWNDRGVDRTYRPDRTERSDRMDRPDRIDRVERSDRTDRPDRPDRTDRPDRPDRTDRPDRPDRTDRPDRPDRTDRPDRMDRTERPDRTDWNRDRDRRGFDLSSDQENVHNQYKTDSALKRNGDTSAREKLFAHKSDAADLKTNGLGRSGSGSTERDRLSALGTSKDRLSPLPRSRNSGRDGYGLSDSTFSNKQHSASDMRNLAVSRRPGEDARETREGRDGPESRDGRDNRNARDNRENRDGRDRALGPMSSSRTQGGHHDNYDKNQSSVTSRLSAGQDKSSEEQFTRYTYPEFLKEYTTIKDAEQRRQYKADFNKDYREYQTLHQMVEGVSQKFATLEKRLRQEVEGSEGYKRIKDQIVQEYIANKKDAKLNEDKKRFQYLHEKLSHIKRLVHEYDTATPKGTVAS